MGKMQRRKGHSFEREIAQIFRTIYPDARRKLEYHEKDALGVDIQDTGPFLIQCKRGRNYAPITKIFEIQGATSDKIPLLVTKGDNRETMVALPLEAFMRLLKDFGEAHITTTLPAQDDEFLK